MGEGDAVMDYLLFFSALVYLSDKRAFFTFQGNVLYHSIILILAYRGGDLLPLNYGVWMSEGTSSLVLTLQREAAESGRRQ